MTINTLQLKNGDDRRVSFVALDWFPPVIEDEKVGKVVKGLIEKCA
jgi:hypothetical protein